MPGGKIMQRSHALNKLIAIRRELHAYPEAGWTEFWTTAYVAKTLEKLGYSVSVGSEVIQEKAVMGRPENIEDHLRRALGRGASPVWIERMKGYTGALATLDTGRPGPVVALRFDMDCVETTEATEEGHRPAREGFASQNPGCMHSCGHDGHTAIGLVLAERLMAEKDQLKGTFRFLFQPAEEGVRGGYAMTEKGLLDNVDYFIALHLGIGVPSGTIAAGTRGFLCTTKFDVTYQGKGAHAGGEPHKGKNALLAAATAALNLHAIAPHSKGLTRLNVGSLQAGEGRNVIAPKAFLKVETRGETNEIAEYVYRQAERIIRAAAEMYDLKWNIRKMGEAVTSASDDSLTKLVSRVAYRMEEVKEVKESMNMSGSDDATWMMNRVQQQGGSATYIVIGSDIAAGHHNDHFDFDENSMFIALELLEGTLREIAKIQ